MWEANSFPGAGQGLQYGQGGIPYGLGASPTAFPNPGASKESAQDENSWDPHLRSTKDVTGHHIQANNGEIGHVEDFIIDDETWAIRYLVIDTNNWWIGKRILVSPQWIDHVSWDELKVFIDLPRESIKQSPEYSKDFLLTRDYESNLHRHYNRKGYWENETADD